MASETNFCTSAVNGDTGNNWSNQTNLYADDGSYANPANANVTNDTHVSGFGFSIPAGATIDGIEIEIEGYDSCNDGSYSVFSSITWDNFTSSTATKNYISGTNLGATPTVYTVGGAADTWGRSWTPAEINDDDNFKVDLSAAADAYATEILVDYLKVTVYYTAAASVPIYIRRLVGLSYG